MIGQHPELYGVPELNLFVADRLEQLWEQMIGRGLRGPRFGGTERCIVYDCVDNFIGEPGKVEGFNQYRASWRSQLTHG